jgi:hypothetical protein
MVPCSCTRGKCPIFFVTSFAMKLPTKFGITRTSLPYSTSRTTINTYSLSGILSSSPITCPSRKAYHQLHSRPVPSPPCHFSHGKIPSPAHHHGPRIHHHFHLRLHLPFGPPTRRSLPLLPPPLAPTQEIPIRSHLLIVHAHPDREIHL